MKKVLIIEDDKGIRENLKAQLEAEHYTVLAASNGEEGIALSQGTTPDIIISDIMMPGIDGYEVIETIRGKAGMPNIPFIFLTAKVEQSDLRKGMEHGADDYLFKPYDVDELLRAIRTRLTRYEIIKAHLADSTPHQTAYLPTDKILFRSGQHLQPVSIENIYFITADREYTNIFVEGNKKYVVKKSLTKWRSILPPGLFCQIHRSIMINFKYVCRIDQTVNHTYKISFNNNEKVFEVSRRFSKNLKIFMPATSRP